MLKSDNSLVCVQCRVLIHVISKSFSLSQMKIEEYAIEFLEVERRTTYTCVSIFHRHIDDIYYGQLYVDRNRDTQHQVQGGSSCLFRLGNRDATKKYSSC